LTPPLHGTPKNIRTNLILPESIVIGILVTDCMGLSSFKFSWWAPKDAHVYVLKHSTCVMAFQGYPRSLILAPIESAYAISRLLFSNSNLEPILPRCRDIAGFLVRTTPPLFHPNFRYSLWTRLAMLWLRGAKTLS